MVTAETISTATKTNTSKYFSGARRYHSSPVITQPHQAFSGKRIELNNTLVCKLKDESSKQFIIGHNNKSIEHEDIEVCAQIIKGGLKLDMISPETAIEFVNCYKKKRDPSKSIDNARAEFLDSLDDVFLAHKRSLETYFEDKPLCKDLTEWSERGFSYEVTISKGDCSIYGGNSDFGLRLDHRDILHSRDLSHLNTAPIPLQRIAGKFLQLLSNLSLKNISQDFIHTTGLNSMFCEMPDSLTYDEFRTLKKHIEKQEYKLAIQLLHDKDALDLEELEYVFGSTEDMLTNVLDICDWWLALEHFTPESFDYLKSMDKFITELTNDLETLAITMNPAIGHPLYAHIVKLLSVLNNEVIKESYAQPLVSQASDYYLSESACISLTESDQYFLTEKNEELMNAGEATSFIIDTSDMNTVIGFLKNIILADYLINAFDQYE